MHLCLSIISVLLSGTFSDKPTRYPRRLRHDTQRGKLQTLTRQSGGRTVLSICWLAARIAARWCQASSHDGRRSETLTLSLPFHDALGSGLSILCLRCEVSVYGPYKVGSLRGWGLWTAGVADVSVVLGVPLTCQLTDVESILLSLKCLQFFMLCTTGWWKHKEIKGT